MIRKVLFDFGGVLAEEGFREGLKEIARLNNKDPQVFFDRAADIVYECGYVTGGATEKEFWSAVRKQCGILGKDSELTGIILDRFVVRPEMMDLVRQLKSRGVGRVILSDQSDWLDRLERRYDFFREFDQVFNSFYMGKSKKDPSLFSDIINKLDIEPGEALFVDDNREHIGRARSMGLQAHLFIETGVMQKDLMERRLI